MEVSGGDKKAHAQINKAVSIPSFKGYTILIVEDNDMNRLVATKFIEKTGADIITAKNGIEAIDIFGNRAVDLILMDLQMPEMDGFEATKQIRKIEQEMGIPKGSSMSQGSLNRTPIIALTAAVMDGDRDRAASAGVDMHLGKPIDEQELYKVIGDFLESKSDPGVQAPEPAESKEPFPIMDDFDLKQGMAASQGDPVFYRKLLRVFDTQLSGPFSDIADSIKTLGVAEIQQLAHTLKGIAGTVGATRIAVIAEEIDKICKSGKRPSIDLAQNLSRAIISARKQMMIHLNKSETDISEEVDAKEGIEALNELLILLTNSEIAGDNLINKAVRYVANRVNRETADELFRLLENFDMSGAEKLIERILEEIKNG
jgi:CheY-like chemotaxis protein